VKRGSITRGVDMIPSYESLLGPVAGGAWSLR
jgi:hypothetical protein